MLHPIASALRTAAAKPKKNGAHGTIDWHGLKVAVEYPKGTERSGVGKDGKRWAVKVPATYGALRGTEAKDGEAVDCYVGDDHASKKVFVVDQKDAHTGKYDEAKCLLSFPSRQAALTAYEKAFSDGKGKERVGGVTELSVPEFSAWLKHGNTKVAMAKKPTDTALQNARAYAHAGRVGYWPGGAPVDPDAIPTEGIAPDGESSAHALRGLLEAMKGAGHVTREGLRPLTPEEWKAARTGEQTRRAQTGRTAVGDFLRGDAPEAGGPGSGIGWLATQLSGIPSIVHGGENVKRGYDEGDPIRGIGGGLEATLGALPIASSLRPIAGPVSAAARPFFKTPLRSAATLTAAGLPTAYSDDAHAAEKKVHEFVSGDPEVMALNAQRQKALTDLQAENRRNERKGPETQKQALAPFQKQIDLIDAKISDAENRARQTFMDQASFREKYPGAPGALLAGGAGLALGLPVAKGVGERVADALWRRPELKDATRKAAQAFATGAPDAETATAQTILRDKLAAWNRQHSGLGAPGGMLGNIVKGGAATAEASAIPEEWDLLTNPPNHPARIKAAEAFHDPHYWQDRGWSAMPGAGLGGLGSVLPKLLPQNKEFLSQAREVSARGEEPSAVERALATLSRKEPQGPSEAAMARVQRYRTAAGPSGEPDDAMNLAGRLGTGPGRDIALPAPIAGTAIDEGTLPLSGGRLEAPAPSLASRIMTQRQLLAPEASPSLPAPEAPQIIYRGKDSLGRTFHKEPETGYFTSVPAPNDPATKVVKKAKGSKPSKPEDTAEKLPVSKANGASTPKDIPVKADRVPGDEDPGFRKNGGATELARRYADGGSPDANGAQEADLGVFSRALNWVRNNISSTALSKGEPNWVGKNILANPDLQPAMLAASFLGPKLPMARLGPSSIAFEHPSATGMDPLRVQNLQAGQEAFHATGPTSSATNLSEFVSPTGVNSPEMLAARRQRELWPALRSTEKDIQRTSAKKGEDHPLVSQLFDRRDRLGKAYSDIGRQPPPRAANPVYQAAKDWNALQPPSRAVYGEEETVVPRKLNANGGAIEDARRYASKDKVVHAGLVKGPTGGRDDAKPISVPSGAYIVPADCVSAVGGGNTDAGAAKFSKMLPKASKPGRADGGATGHIPIRISDGEIVVSPEQVAALGNGNVEQGHRVLDALVKKIRADHIATLKSLPGPAC